MKLISTFLLVLILFSCSEKKEAQSEIDGVWRMIGRVQYENFTPKDTIFFPKDSLIWQKKTREGNRYKIYADGHSIWFYSRAVLDSLGQKTGESDDLFGKTSYSTEKDSMFESFDFWHDNGNKWIDWLKKDEIHYRATYNQVGESYGQYSNSEGKGSEELYERLDTYGVTPTVLTGNWKRVASIRIRNDKPTDTFAFNPPKKSGNGHHLSFADNMTIRAFNFVRKDSLGNDIWPGRAMFLSYKVENDTLVEEKIFETGFYNKKTSPFQAKRKFEIKDNQLFLENINRKTRDGSILVFDKI